MNTDHFVEETRDIFLMLDGAEYPEAKYALDEILGEDGVPNESPYEIASKLIQCDLPKEFPQFLLDYIAGLYEREIEEGNADAMNDLGAMYYLGSRGYEQSFEKAVSYYHMAAEHGCRQAQENLGYCYYYGRDVERDYKKAFHYFALGAFDGHLISLYKIGDMYLNGYYVEKNEIEAFEIYMRCLDTMTSDAEEYVAGPVYLRLGNMFLKGLGTKKDPKNALICYQKAEDFLHSMVMKGDSMYKKSLIAAIDGQAEARKLLMDDLPSGDWHF